MTPLQPLIHEDLADAASLDRDPLALVEVVPQAVERPAAEGEAEAVRFGQGGGDDLGPLLGSIGLRAPGPWPILEPAESPVIEAVDPCVDSGLADAQVAGDLAGASPISDGKQDPGPLDEASLSRARGRPLFEDLAFLGGELSQRHFGEGHGCTSHLSEITPFLRQTRSVSSLGGCTT
jgi:hypothetical protein